MTGRGGCEMLKVPHSLVNRFIDGSEDVNLTHRPWSTPQKHFYVSGTYLS
jgi:hypothetical protein